MATTKTIQPTGTTITIPAMTDRPDASVYSTDVERITDAVNAVNSKLGKCKIKTFTMNVTTTVSSNAGGYAGEMTLTTSDIENAKVVIPVFGRKSGNNFPIVVAYEVDVLRAWSPIALTDVTVGVALLFYT